MTRVGVISRVAGSVHRSVRSGRSVEVESASASKRAAGAEGREMDTSSTRREEDVRLRIVSGDGRGLRICSVPQVVVPGRRREGGGRGLVHTLTARHSYATAAAFLKRAVRANPKLGLGHGRPKTGAINV